MVGRFLHRQSLCGLGRILYIARPRVKMRRATRMMQHAWQLRKALRARGSIWSSGSRPTTRGRWLQLLSAACRTQQRKPIFASPSKCHVSMCSVSLQYALVSRAPFIAAGRSDAEKRRHQLGQFYDEYCRKDWAERSARGDVCFARCILSICMCGRPASAGDTDFDIRVACNRLDEELLTQARAAYDIEYSPKAAAKGSGEKEKHNESGELLCTQPHCISARVHFQVLQGASAGVTQAYLEPCQERLGQKQRQAWWPQSEEIQVFGCHIVAKQALVMVCRVAMSSPGALSLLHAPGRMGL